MSVDVRLYRRSDRVAVRRICCDTADAGRPLEALFDEPQPLPALRDLFADLLVSAYTDVSNPLVWVAVQEGDVVGYLTGCLNEIRLARVRLFRVLPATLTRAVLRGVWARRSFLQFAWANRNALWERTPRFPVEREYPAHLHINLVPIVRGAGIGGVLVDRFVEVAKNAGSSGIAVSVREDNTRGRAFFERNGFVPLARRRLFRLASGVTRYAVIHGRKL